MIALRPRPRRLLLRFFLFCFHSFVFSRFKEIPSFFFFFFFLFLFLFFFFVYPFSLHLVARYFRSRSKPLESSRGGANLTNANGVVAGAT